MAISNSKRLAKNTVLMYIRMLFLLCITFYTSRVILQQLGVEDYGIYNVVGSVVAMFSSLRSIFAMSTQRFLNFELGANNNDKLKTIYNTSIQVNLIISVIFVLIVEIVGMWFFNAKINVPDNRYFAASCVFHFSVLTSVITIMNTTFDAEIIAHEKMDFFAYLSIFEGIAKLLIVYLLSVSSFDKLIYYAVLHLLVVLTVTLINREYCKKKFEECQFVFKIDEGYLKKMTSFAGWNFIGTNAYVLAQNGMNMVLNIFGGPIINAARGVAHQINSAVSQCTNNVVIVVNPYCVKTYASGNHGKAMDAIILSSKILFLVQICVSIPIVFGTNFVLSFWLGKVPDYSVEFSRVILLYSIIRSIHPSIDTWFKAVGNIRFYQVFEGILLLLPIVVSYYALENGMPYVSAFLFMCVFEIVNLIGILLIAKKISDFSIKSYMLRVLVPCYSLLFMIGTFFFFYEKTNSDDNIITLGVVSACMILSVLYMYVVGFNTKEKGLVKDVLKIKRTNKD